MDNNERDMKLRILHSSIGALHEARRDYEQAESRQKEYGKYADKYMEAVRKYEAEIAKLLTELNNYSF